MPSFHDAFNSAILTVQQVGVNFRCLAETHIVRGIGTLSCPSEAGSTVAWDAAKRSRRKQGMKSAAIESSGYHQTAHGGDRNQSPVRFVMHLGSQQPRQPFRANAGRANFLMATAMPTRIAPAAMPASRFSSKGTKNSRAAPPCASDSITW